ncbi:hypothetical protein GpartN1_g6403.t1 [Galdieria partita]|uniref:Uncharacterized protein n=1 Tax=Galdieria partita TaxID=83374 RepID=A0A9C7Q2Y9_9RHOD|nr:hypothetical protein GpartN1_g6403.t1 [Galdieria partita]
MCRCIQEQNIHARKQTTPSLVPTPMNNKGVILAFQDNQLYVAYWNVITIIIVHSGQNAILLPSNDYFKHSCVSEKTQNIQVTRIELQPQVEYVLVASDSLCQCLTLEGIMRMVERLLRRNVSVQSIAETLVKAACSLGYRGELALHLILLRKPEWNLDIPVHGGNIYNTVRGYLPHCSQDYFSSGIKNSFEGYKGFERNQVSSVCESRNIISSREKLSVNGPRERRKESESSTVSPTSYYSASTEEQKKNLQNEDRKDSSALCHSKDDVDDSLLQLIKENSHFVS